MFEDGGLPVLGAIDRNVARGLGQAASVFGNVPLFPLFPSEKVSGDLLAVHADLHLHGADGSKKNLDKRTGQIIRVDTSAHGSGFENRNHVAVGFSAVSVDVEFGTMKPGIRDAYRVPLVVGDPFSKRHSILLDCLTNGLHRPVLRYDPFRDNSLTTRKA
jgi:hypothetical protein